MSEPLACHDRRGILGFEQPRLIFGVNAAFLCREETRADLHAACAEHHCRRKPSAVCDAARSDDGDFHGVADLRHQCHCRHLADMPAGLRALRDDRIRSGLFHQGSHCSGGDHRNDPDAGFVPHRDIFRRIARAGCHNRNLLFCGQFSDRVYICTHQHEIHAERLVSHSSA